jgi:hypothetical protein
MSKMPLFFSSADKKQHARGGKEKPTRPVKLRTMRPHFLILEARRIVGAVAGMNSANIVIG